MSDEKTTENIIENTDVVLKIEGLCKGYKMFTRKKDRILETIFPWIQRHGMFEAMKDFNLELRKGEVLGVLGKNGAGKSTLLKMITGVVTPTSGIIEVSRENKFIIRIRNSF
jgi:ABC-type polysaccharide/polyol phosphate transport system ATPase subunit